MRSLFRRLARYSRFQLAAGYALAVTVATFVYDLGVTLSRPTLQIVGGLLGLIAFSILFPVVTWYRRDEVPGAAFLLALASTLAYIAGAWITLAFVIPDAGAAAILGFGTLMSLPIRILVAALVFGVLVSLGRRFRAVFAPDTMEQTTNAGAA